MTQRTAAEIATELTAFRTARAALIKGERVTEMGRAGRRLIYAGISLRDVETAIASLEREYEAAVAVEAGRARRRPIGLAWRN